MGVVSGRHVITMVQNALNMVDGRLVDHGMRVAAVMKDMLEIAGIQKEELKEELCIIAMLHDVGAYQTEEIDRLVQFETKSIWEHSINGYLFLKEFTNLGELAKVVLYHHADADLEVEESEEIMRYAQILHVADRVDVWNYGSRKKDAKELKNYFRKKRGTIFSDEAVGYFLEADEKLHTIEKLQSPTKFDEIIESSVLNEETIKTYLWVLVHAIDFRSHVTVSHTVSVIDIACQIAQRMGMSGQEQEQVYYGAMLHDIGKIGTPVSILEKPGKLTADEMDIMREHVELGRQIIEGCVDETVVKIALRHHEKLDGSGYPGKIPGREISTAERILAVADMASALCMRRSYKEPFPKERVFSILNGMRDKGQIDADVVATLEEGYDDIIKHAEDTSLPVERVYEQMNEEYNRLLKYYTAAAV